MKYFTFCILLGLVGSVFSGGSSLCGELRIHFLELLQACETLVDQMAASVINVINTRPLIGGSYITFYYCHLNVITYMLATGTSQMSGINEDYIHGILNGTVSPPFVAPLDCIESELLSYVSYVRNISDNVIQPLEPLVETSTINSTSNCSIVVQYVTSFYTYVGQITQYRTTQRINDAANFARIGQLSLYTQYFDSINLCMTNTLSNSISELMNMNVSIINAFLANQSTPVPPPLSCITGLASSANNILNAGINQVINSIVVPPSPSPNCDPFYTNFKAFAAVWYGFINQLRDFASSNSIQYPVLTPYFVDSLICELDIMIIFAANATSVLSDVNSDTIYDILNGSTVPPFAHPLDCVASDLTYMSSQISNLRNNIIPGMLNFAITSNSNTSTCNSTYIALSSYVGTLVTLLNSKGLIVTNATSSFSSINMSDLFLETFASVLECLPNLVGKYIGSALNANGALVSAYVSGARMTVPYPFNCANIIINIINSLMNQALVDYITDTPANLLMPKIPKFIG